MQQVQAQKTSPRVSFYAVARRQHPSRDDGIRVRFTRFFPFANLLKFRPDMTKNLVA